MIYALTSLSEAGNRDVREMDEARYRAYIDSWKTEILKGRTP